jgi:hypothetical protein
MATRGESAQITVSNSILLRCQFIDWAFSRNRPGRSSPNLSPPFLHPPVPTRTLSPCLRHYPTTTSSSASCTNLPSSSNAQPPKRPKTVKLPPKDVPRLSKAPQANLGDVQRIDEDDEEGDGEGGRTITLSTPSKRRTPWRELRRHSLPTLEAPCDAPERLCHLSEDDRTPHRNSIPSPIVPLPPLISIPSFPSVAMIIGPILPAATQAQPDLLLFGKGYQYQYP